MPRPYQGHWVIDLKSDPVPRGLYFQPIFDLWVNRWGKRVAFRFMLSNMHSRLKYVTPKWVFDSGVPFLVHKGLYIDEQVDPVFWDERYLKIQNRFIADLGKSWIAFFGGTGSVGTGVRDGGERGLNLARPLSRRSIASTPEGSMRR